ncbi:IS110 family transposase [Yersinia enterocolitica]|uniref:IS110 family transposase n=1 Tax=Yersinia enterocolitica TaxID=630 RepID=UPI00398CA445
MLDTLRQFEPDTLIAMEACSTSHFWGRTLSSMGYSVRLIPALHVKAFVRSQKSDANDALAICEAACRPGIHFVPVKTTEQQDIKALRNTRQLMVEQKMVSFFLLGSSVSSSSYLNLLKMHLMI